MNTTASKLVINARKGNNEKEKDSKILHLNYTMLPYCDLFYYFLKYSRLILTTNNL